MAESTKTNKKNSPLRKALNNPDGAFSSGSMADKLERRLKKERAARKKKEKELLK